MASSDRFDIREGETAEAWLARMDRLAVEGPLSEQERNQLAIRTLRVQANLAYQRRRAGRQTKNVPPASPEPPTVAPSPGAEGPPGPGRFEQLVQLWERATNEEREQFVLYLTGAREWPPKMGG